MNEELTDINLKELIEREAGGRFDKHNKIKCCFHADKTASLSVKFNSDTNKYIFKCFGCGEFGDSIDFIQKYKNLDYIKAREYLGLTTEKNETEIQIEKIQSFIDWQIKKFKIGYKLKGLLPYVNEKNEIIYFQAKFIPPDPGAKKECSYYHIENDKVINKRKGEELPYNLYNVIDGIKNNKKIILTEGPKDANTINNLLKGSHYVATSMKNVKDTTILNGASICVCSDSGSAGDKYIEFVKEQLFESSKAFKIINLPGLKDLGDNKDVTDWLESGHTKSELLQAFKRSLDLKSRYELQQDFAGIYKLVKNKDENGPEFVKVYISNFTLLEATSIEFVDNCIEGVKVVLLSPKGNKIERIDTVNVFDEVKSFKGFLGSLELSFVGNIADLTTFKTWISNYFAINLEQRHTGVKFINKDNVRMLITNDGAVTNDKINTFIKSDEGTDVNIINVDEISPDEMIEVERNLFTFATLEKTFSIIGSLISFLMTEQMVTLKIKNHHLNMVGESGSGKSTILENVIAPILNYPKNDIKSVGLITPFALIKNLSDGNYPILFDEYKPSSLDKFKNLKLSETLRNLYDRSTVSRSDKNFKNRNFQLNRPIILAGEESYPNSEKPLIERSCIVYLSKVERAPKHIASMSWLIKNEKLLNKLGKSLIYIVLELSSEDYQAIRANVAIGIDKMKDRPLNTCINICSGIEILNLLLEKLNLNKICNYTEYVVNNIKEEVLGNREEALSQVEEMLKKYNSMIEDGRARDVENVIQCREEGLFIKSSEMLNQISEYLRSVNSSWIPLDLNDFRKQAMKAGYLTGKGDKSIYISLLKKPIRYDTCSIEKFRSLDVSSIVSPEVEDITDLDNIIPFKESYKRENIQDKSNISK